MYENRGKLYLKGDSSLALVYALSFLKNLSPLQALSYLGRHQPKYALRALYIKNFSSPLSDKDISNILGYGFNALVGEYPGQSTLKTFSLVKSEVEPLLVKGETLLDHELKNLHLSESNNSNLIYYSDNPLSFEELNFHAVKAKLSFSNEKIWDLLGSVFPFGTPLLPYIKLPAKNLPLLAQNDLSSVLNKMVRHPFAGMVVEVDSLPKEGSFAEANLFVAGFSQFLNTDPKILTKYWFVKHHPTLWNVEAIELFDQLAKFNPKENSKADRQKILGDIAVIQERWPDSPYAEAAAIFNIFK